MRHAKRQAMAQDAAKKQSDKKRSGHPIISGVVSLFLVVLIGLGGHQLVYHPDTPLPPQWNPTQPLLVSDPVTPITSWKLDRAAANGAACLGALNGVAALQSMANLETSDQCHIRDRVSLTSVGGTRLNDVETRCAIALRLAMWERHSLQPAALDILGSALTGIDHIGSYNCRALRTSSGQSKRMSTHATADAIDIAGFRFADGRKVNLISGWYSETVDAQFLRAARDSACDWFKLTLSPDYNRLHADHFHLQSKGWGLCR